MEKRSYTVTLQLTEEEARTLLDTAAKREQGIGEFLSEIVSYIHGGRGGTRGTCSRTTSRGRNRSGRESGR